MSILATNLEAIICFNPSMRMYVSYATVTFSSYVKNSDEGIALA